MVSRLVVAALIASLAASFTPALAQSSPGCGYVLGFEVIYSAIPTVVGACIDNEAHNPTNGDAVQHTSNGLLVWRKADNFTAFTDGYRSWVDGPSGIQERLNSQRFAWEANPESMPIVGGTAITATQAIPSGLTVSCAPGDQNCQLAQQVLPRPNEAPDGFALTVAWEDTSQQYSTFNVRMTNGSEAITVHVEPYPTEGDATAAYDTQLNPGPLWQQVTAPHPPQIGYSADEYAKGSEFLYGWRNKNVFILFDVTGVSSYDATWLAPLAQTMQSRLAGLIGAEAPQSFGPPPATPPQPTPVPQPAPAPAPVVPPAVATCTVQSQTEFYHTMAAFTSASPYSACAAVMNELQNTTLGGDPAIGLAAKIACATLGYYSFGLVTVICGAATSNLGHANWSYVNGGYHWTGSTNVCNGSFRGASYFVTDTDTQYVGRNLCAWLQANS